MATLVRQAYVLGPSALSEIGPDGRADVLIDGGVIAAIAPALTTLPYGLSLQSDTLEVIEAEGCILGPGLIDLYSQCGEPGYESRETYQSLGRAAAAGGFTRVGLLPNAQPPADYPAAIAAVHQANRHSSNGTSEEVGQVARLLPWAAITQGLAGAQLTELAELAAAGALGFTDGQPLGDAMLLRRLLEYALPLHKPIALWPCDQALSGQGVAREGVDALRLGLMGASTTSETTALARLLEYVVEIPCQVHLMRVSTGRGVDLIRQAKDRGLPVTASVPWHHLIFDTQDLGQYDPNLHHDPPLGTPTDRQALIAGVAEGVIDAIAIDHSPYTYEEKTVPFDLAPPGAIGLELALPVLWKTFVAEGQWSPQQLWQSLSRGPAHCLGMPPPTIAKDHPAELTLFDPNLPWEATASTLRSLSCNTPWLSQALQGKVLRIWQGR